MTYVKPTGAAVKCDHDGDVSGCLSMVFIENEAGWLSSLERGAFGEFAIKDYCPACVRWRERKLAELMKAEGRP